MFSAVHIRKPLVYKATYTGDLHEAVKRIRSTALNIKPNKGVMNGGGVTTVNEGTEMPHTWNEFNEFMLWLKPQVEKLWKEWNLDPAELAIAKSWCNITKNLAYVEEHDHGGCHWAVSFYLTKPEGSGNIEFRDLDKELYSNFPMARPGWTEVPANQGDVLIFPGFLSHRVQPNPTNEERIVLSFNIHGDTGNSPVLTGE